MILEVFIILGLVYFILVLAIGSARDAIRSVLGTKNQTREKESKPC